MSDNYDDASDSSKEPQETRRTGISVLGLLRYNLIDWLMRRSSASIRKAVLHDVPEHEALLAQEQADREKAKEEISKLTSLVKALKEDDYMRLGRSMFAESNYGIFILGNGGEIILANQNACTYSGVDLEDMIGQKPSEVFEGNSYAKTYCQVFEENAAALISTERVLPPNTFEFDTMSGRAPFDIQAHTSSEGGFIVLRPFKTQGLIERLLQRRPSLVYLSGKVTFDVLLDEHIGTMLNANPKKPFYFDFKDAESVSSRALDSIAKFYHIFQNKKIACVFKDIPEDAAHYLMEQHGIDKVHIRRMRPVEHKSVAYDAAPSTNPG